MKERPILFSGPMVRAILEGRKTQTRRIVKPQPADDVRTCNLPNNNVTGWESSLRHSYGPTTVHVCPYGNPGDRLWVREKWAEMKWPPTGPRFVYSADKDCDFTPWRPSIHMPRWASRITLEVASVRMERLQDISEADAIAEGIERVRGIERGFKEVTPLWKHYTDPSFQGADQRGSFRSLWQSINGPESWAANPWVWVVEFKCIKP